MGEKSLPLDHEKKAPHWARPRSWFAGVVFLPENGNGPGVALKKP